MSAIERAVDGIPEMLYLVVAVMLATATNLVAGSAPDAARTLLAACGVAVALRLHRTLRVDA